MRGHGTQLVHSHEFTMAVYGSVAARRRAQAISLRCTAAGITLKRGAGAPPSVAIKRSGAATAVSGATATDLRRTLGVPCDAVRILPNGIRMPNGRREKVRRELNVHDDELVIVAIGNLYPVKGHAVLLRALAALDEQGGAPGAPSHRRPRRGRTAAPLYRP